MTHDPCARRGPPWWTGREPWSRAPRAAGMDPRQRARFFRRMALAAAAFVLLLSGIFALAWLAAARLPPSGWSALLSPVVVASAALLVLVVLFSGMRRVARPLGAVMDAADRVAEGDYSTRVRPYGPPPIRALAHSFNTMTERLQDADRLRRNLMADVAHELRTPLSILQGRLEGLIDGVYARDDDQLARLLEETRVLSRLVDDLRTVALSDAGALELQREPIDLTGLAADAVHGFDGDAAAKAVTLSLAVPHEPVVLEIDPVRVREVLTNLLSNALRHTPSGGSVELKIVDAGAWVTLAVGDTGDGMSPEDVARIFDRFYKGPRSSGTGLGLAIAKGIVAAHGGEISAASQLGRGTVVTVLLPRPER
jgi:signal transduction histidine kinase